MRIHLLGTVGYHPTETRHTASFFLPEPGIALDAGTGFFRVRPLMQRDSLDVFVSHAHLDHCVGLSFLLDIMLGRKINEVRVHGAADKLASIRNHMLADLQFPAAVPVQWNELKDGSLDLPQGCRMTWFPLHHPGGSVGYRFDWPDRSLAYVTDTTASPTAPYVEAIKGVDLLLHECNFTDDMREWAVLTGHSCTSDVAEVARQARVGKLVLVHVNPLGDDADPVNLPLIRSIFPNAVLGRDGDVIEF